VSRACEPDIALMPDMLAGIAANMYTMATAPTACRA
jgi:hypothetical protein